MFKNIIKLAAATIVSFGLMGSVALASSGSITGPTGAFSYNAVNNFSFSVKKTVNVNKAKVTNVSVQGASTGDAVAVFNTTVGNVHTGDASNTNTTTTTITQSN